MHPQNTRHALTGPTPEYRLKEKYFVRKVEVGDLEDTQGECDKFIVGNVSALVYIRVARVLEYPGKSWNWGEKFPGPGNFLNLGCGP